MGLTFDGRRLWFQFRLAFCSVSGFEDIHVEPAGAPSGWEDRELTALRRESRAAERGKRQRAAPCRWAGMVVYRRQCCDYIECRCPGADKAEMVVVSTRDCRLCPRQEPVMDGDSGDIQG
jgi:hypothetical protein